MSVSTTSVATEVEEARRRVAALEAEENELQGLACVVAKARCDGTPLTDDIKGRLRAVAIADRGNLDDVLVELKEGLMFVREMLQSGYTQCTILFHREALTRALAPQKRGHEPSGETPGATRVRPSSPRTPLPTGVPQLHPPAPEKQSSQASSLEAQAVYSMLNVQDFTFDYDYDNEDEDIHEPLTTVQQRSAEVLELAVSEYIFRSAHDLFPVRCKSSQRFYFETLYTSAKGTQCLYWSSPDLLVFHRANGVDKAYLSANTCRQYKPLLIEIQSGSETAEESKVQLVTTLFSFVEHTGRPVEVGSVYGIVVEQSLERIHVVRFEDGKYQTDGPFPARCLINICKTLLCA